ncbi:hypothetical protein [Blastococcus litoris]|uniref:hypothetical protein n=1 Tax=Blastococcus litoris TaxID=2171622 RepID=UPI000E302B34|nr:hypothetical protein [Blastococcus litoris]
MYARSTTVHGDPQLLDQGIAYIRDTMMPAVRQMDGCIGLSMLSDRTSGRSIVTTSWADAEAMRRSADPLAPMRRRAAQLLGGEAGDLNEWEIAVMHRSHETHNGACARVMVGEGDPARIDELVDSFRMGLLPRIEDLPGFVSLSLMVDRTSGRTAAAVGYDSRQSMAEAEAPGRALRQEFTGHMRTEVTDVAVYDIILAHLRVPETT